MRLKKITMVIMAALLSANLPAKSSTTNDNKQDILHLNWRDTHYSPSQDFYAYANGTWQKENPIPPEYASWSTFSLLQERVQKRIHNMLIAAAADKHAQPGSIEQKVGDFYFSGMDETLIDKMGATPLQPEFDKINAIKNLDDLQAVVTHLQLIGVNALFNFGSMQDFKNSKEMIGVAGQGGLGLPDRDYYLKDDAKFKAIRVAYVQHISKMLQLLGTGAASAAKEADAIMAIEMELAKHSMSQVAQRSPMAIYHIMTVAELDKLTPNFSWSHYFKAIDQADIKHINLAMPTFFKKLNQQLKTVSLTDWQSYLRWHLINAYAAYLSSPFVEQTFQMTKTLTGTEKLLPRWKRVVNTENAALGFAIGKMYVEKYFSASDKEKVLAILHNIRQVLQQDLQTLSWMTPDTRKAALAKLALIEERVGYPEKWWDYSAFSVDRGPYVLNVMRANLFLSKRDLDKIGKPIDRTEWSMTPQTINAYYDASMNNINMPAGILQPPFFDPKAPAALNYGAIGFVMGHEMTHGFDDQGAQFDGYGNLKNWWKPADLKKFQAATHCIVQQFSSYKVDGDLPVQGELVVGEATADLGGLTLAYRAFHASDDYKHAKTINGFTPDQQFFLGSAHVWAGNMRPQQERNLVTTDPHPPMRYRVNGTLANMPQFESAFSVVTPSMMVNNNRCVIW